MILPLSCLEERIHDSHKYNYRYINTDFLTEYKIVSVKNLSVFILNSAKDTIIDILGNKL